MAISFIDDTNLTAIADAIRSIKNSTDTYLPSEMAMELNSIAIQKYYTGTDEPDASLGSNGDLYLKTT